MSIVYLDATPFYLPSGLQGIQLNIDTFVVVRNKQSGTSCKQFVAFSLFFFAQVLFFKVEKTRKRQTSQKEIGSAQ